MDASEEVKTAVMQRVSKIVKDRKDALARLDAALDDRDTAVNERDAAREERDAAFDECDAALDERDDALHDLKDADREILWLKRKLRRANRTIQSLALDLRDAERAAGSPQVVDPSDESDGAVTATDDDGDASPPGRKKARRGA